MSTKKLARELGLIRKRSQSSSIHKLPSTSKQIFSYVMVIDFESTCWREKNHYTQEIIEFPAVLMNTSTGEIESEFHSYVQPQEHPVLSSFCRELTGITQEQVEAGLPLPVCLSRFSRWLQSLQQEKGLAFLPTTPPTTATGSALKHCSFITWSDWDLAVCLLYECKRKQITKPDVLNSWIDLRATYRIFYNRKPKGLNGALQDLGITFRGREHSGLDDARNTARLAWQMIMDGCVLRTTRSLMRVEPKQGRGHGAVPTSRRPDQYLLTETESSSYDDVPLENAKDLPHRTRPLHSCPPIRGDLTAPRIPFSIYNDRPDHSASLGPSSLLVPNVNQSAHRTGSINQSDRVSDFINKSAVSLCTSNQSDRMLRSSNRSVYIASYLNQSVLTSIPGNQSALSSRFLNQSASSCSRPGNQSVLTSIPGNQSALSSRFLNQSASSCSRPGNQSVLTSIPGNQSALSSRFLNQSASSVKSIKQPSFSRPGNQSALCSSSLQQSALSFSRPSPLVFQRDGVKITSPMCECGRRSKRSMVSNGGPNQGRAFYTCAVRKSSAPCNSAPQSKGCGFFKWESALVRSSLPTGGNSLGVRNFR